MEHDTEEMEGQYSQNGVWDFASKTFTPKWCKTDDHWSVKFATRFFVDCLCCFFWRAFTLGFISGTVFTLSTALFFYIAYCIITFTP
jgi:hypothetical protein